MAVPANPKALVKGFDSINKAKETDCMAVSAATAREAEELPCRDEIAKAIDTGLAKALLGEN